MVFKKNTMVYQLDDFTIDITNRQILKADLVLALNARYFDVLIYLIANPQRLITKEELFLEVWGDHFVSDTALGQCIKDIRKILADDARNPKYIKTVPKHGLIFLKSAVKVKTYDDKSAASFSGHKRPYKFLDYYSEDDHAIYFGREQEISEICSKILNHRSFIIHGRSGVGKSSLVHAGLVPQLKKQGHHPYIIRSFSNPSKELKEIFNTRDLNQSHDLICFFDQFEEFFLLAPPQARQKFIDQIEEMFNQKKSNIRLVFILREDLLAGMSDFKTVLPEIFFHEYRLRRFTIDQAYSVICNPARNYNLPFEKKLVETIIQDLQDDAFIDPPQLQIVCDTLYDHRDSSAGLTLNIYQKLGRTKGILANYLEQVLHHFDKQQLITIKQILLLLINEKTERQILSKNELEKNANLFIEDKNILNDFIEELSSLRVIRIFRLEGETWVELTHDFLAHEISKWQTEEIRTIKQIKKLISGALKNFQNHNILLDLESILFIQSAGNRIVLNNQESEFLIRSMLVRGLPISKWLVDQTRGAQKLIQEYINDNNPEIRTASIESTVFFTNDTFKSILADLSLKEKNLNVKKAAALALSHLYENGTVKILETHTKSDKINIIQHAICLSIIRDHDKSLVSFKRINIFLTLIILSGLMWVRFQRNKSEILKQSLSASIGTAISGLIFGQLLGSLLTIYREQPLFESITILLSLSSLGILSGFLVGYGIGFGLNTSKYIGYRHSSWWMIPGAALGGWLIGGLINLIGVDIFIALSGQNLSGLAGAFEAGVIGLGLASGYYFTLQMSSQNKWIKILIPAAGAMFAAIILTFIEGSMFSASIEKIAQSFQESQIDFKVVANIFGEKYFGQISKLTLAALEGFAFGASFYLADKFKFLFGKD